MLTGNISYKYTMMGRMSHCRPWPPLWYTLHKHSVNTKPDPTAVEAENKAVAGLNSIRIGDHTTEKTSGKKMSPTENVFIKSSMSVEMIKHTAIVETSAINPACQLFAIQKIKPMA